MYIADHGDNVIRKVDTNGIITTVGKGPSTLPSAQWTLQETFTLRG